MIIGNRIALNFFFSAHERFSLPDFRWMETHRFMFRAGNLLSQRNNLEFRSSARQSAGIQFCKFTAVTGWSQAVKGRASQRSEFEQKTFRSKNYSVLIHLWLCAVLKMFYYEFSTDCENIFGNT